MNSDTTPQAKRADDTDARGKNQEVAGENADKKTRVGGKSAQSQEPDSKKNCRQDVLETMEATISKHSLADSDSPVLLMVSGGSDSTALSYLALELSKKGLVGPLAMLHVNHKIRGEASDGDQVFVSELAEALGIPFYACEIDVPAEVARTGDNEEAVARRERYLAANEALASFCRYAATPLSEGRIFTAHTQDDRVENFYMRSIVGTGPGGFRSMLYRNGPIVRPLLDLSREDLRGYIFERERNARKNDETVVCDTLGNLWREDATNAHTDRFRSFVRYEMVAKAKERNPRLLDTLCRSMNLIADEDDMLERWVEEIEGESISWLSKQADGEPEHKEGCLIDPSFGEKEKPLQRRVGRNILQKILGPDERILTDSVEAIVGAFQENEPTQGYTNNIQGNLALSANKKGLRIEPMERYRARRKNI